MADRPAYDAYDIQCPQWNSVSQQSQYPSSIGQCPPSHGTQPHSSRGAPVNTTRVPNFNGYNDRTTAPYASVPPTTSISQQAVYPPLNQPIPSTQLSHQSHSRSYSHHHQSQPYQPYANAPPSSPPQQHLSSRSQSHSQVHGYSAAHSSSQAPVALQQEQRYLPHAPFTQSLNLSPQYPASPSRPFACDMCALSFSRAHDLRRHRETHTGEKPFPCNGGCGKTFSRKDAMRRHQLVKQCGIVEEAWP